MTQAAAQPAMRTLNPSEQRPQDTYKLLVGAVVPRPIAFVSSVDAQGVRNLAPFSFFTVASANPPIVCFCPMVRGVNEDGLQSTKDTLRNILATKEFVLNVVSEDFAEKMNVCSGDYPPEVDEFAVSGLTPMDSEIVRPPRVAESQVQMECRLEQVVHVSTERLGGSLVLGEVLRFHIRESLLDNFRIDPDKLRAIGRMAGSTYARTTDRFEMERPTIYPVERMIKTENLIAQVYSAFNQRNIDGALAFMSDAVSWPKVSEGGRAVGKEEVRAYWSRQWKEFDPHVDPLEVLDQGLGRTRVRIHQLVKSLGGDVLSDSEVWHVYTIANGLIERMDLGGGEANSQQLPSSAFSRH